MHLAHCRAMSWSEVTNRLRQAETDLRDADFLELSPSRRLAFAYEGARQAAVACLGALDIDYRTDLQSFKTGCKALNLSEADFRVAAYFVNVYQDCARNFHYSAPVDAAAAGKMVNWANTIVVAIRQYLGDFQAGKV